MLFTSGFPRGAPLGARALLVGVRQQVRRRYGGPVPDDLPAPPAAASSYDPQVVARDAMSKDPGLSSGLALRLAREAGEILATMSDWDAPELSRRLLADSPETGATPANCVAKAAVEHCRGTGVRFAR
jgi:hypothetical protein